MFFQMVLLLNCMAFGCEMHVVTQRWFLSKREKDILTAFPSHQKDIIAEVK